MTKLKRSWFVNFKMKRILNPIEAKILTVLLKSGDDYMTTAQVAKEAKISWNTALSYLKVIHERGWVEKLGDRTIYWKAIVQEEE